MSSELEQLQTNLAFQEHALSEFNTVVTSQQQQIDLLKLEIRLLKEKLADLEERIHDGGGRGAEHEIPPHY